MQFLHSAEGILIGGRDGWIVRKTSHGMFCAICLLYSQWQEERFRSACAAPYIHLQHSKSHWVYSPCQWWLRWQQDCNFQNLHLVFELQGSLVYTSALHLQVPHRFSEANSQLLRPSCTPVLTWYFKRLRNVNVHDLKTVSSFQFSCSLSFFRL